MTGFKSKTIKGIGWMGLLQGLIKSFAIIRIAILARLLSQHEIGLFSAVILLLGLLETFTEFGIGTFFIQTNKRVEKFINNAFVIQLIRGLGLSVLMVVLSIPASIFFREKEIVQLIYIGSLIPLIKSFENPYILNFQKNLEFGKEFLLRSISTFLDMLFIVCFAFYFQNPMGIVVALIFSTTFYVIFTWILLKRRPKFKIDRNYLVEFLTFAKSISILGTVTFLVQQIDSFIVGRFLGVANLGGYQVIQKFSYVPMNDASSVIGKVTFPVYSKFSNDKARLRKAYLSTLKWMIAVEALALVVILLFTETILYYLAGLEFVQLSNILRLLAVYGFIYSVWGSIGALLFALKKQNFLIVVTVIRLAFLVPLLLVGVTSFGLTGVTYALILSIIFVLPLSLYYVYRQLW